MRSATTAGDGETGSNGGTSHPGKSCTRRASAGVAAVSPRKSARSPASASAAGALEATTRNGAGRARYASAIRNARPPPRRPSTRSGRPVATAFARRTTSASDGPSASGRCCIHVRPPRSYGPAGKPSRYQRRYQPATRAESELPRTLRRAVLDQRFGGADGRDARPAADLRALQRRGRVRETQRALEGPVGEHPEDEAGVEHVAGAR